MVSPNRPAYAAPVPWPADQGDRAAQQAHGGVKVEEARRAEADRVLHDDQDDADREEHEQAGPPLHEHPGVGGQAHRREEDQEEHVLQRQVEAHVDVQQAMDQGQDHSHQSPADDRGGNVEAPEQAHAAHQGAADEQDDHRDEERRDQVELYSAHAPGGSSMGTAMYDPRRGVRQ